jgi:nucleotide-binding universal stress UspA family protein
MSAVHQAPESVRDELRRETIPLRILVAASGEASSLGALRLASALSTRAQSEVSVIAAAAPIPYAPPRMGEPSLSATLNDDRRRATLDATRRELDVVPEAAAWTLHAVVGWAAEAILDEATEWGASLIVVGVARHHVMQRLAGAQTAVAVARHAPVPVIAVPAHVTGLPTRVLAAVDFSPSSLRAAHLAARLAMPGSTLILAHVSALRPDADSDRSLSELYNGGCVDRLELLAAELREHGPATITTMLLSGDIAEQLDQCAEREQCDMIAVGGHMQNFIERVVIGSVRTKLLRAASRTILVAPSNA